MPVRATDHPFAGVHDKGFKVSFFSILPGVFLQMFILFWRQWQALTIFNPFLL